MKWVDLEFQGTIAYFGESVEPYIYSDSLDFMQRYKYPNETQWALITAMENVLSHIETGVDVEQDGYPAGFSEACEIILVNGQEIIKERAISSLTVAQHETLSMESSARIKEQWTKSAIETLARSHKKAGVDLNRDYQVGSYVTFQRLKTHIDQQNVLAEAGEQTKGSGFDVEL
mgnify:CR=1 FL=1